MKPSGRAGLLLGDPGRRPRRVEVSVSIRRTILLIAAAVAIAWALASIGSVLLWLAGSPKMIQPS